MKLLEKIRDILRWVIRTLSADFLEDISRIQQFNLSTAEMHHRAFKQYKACNTGKDVAIIACGPSLKDYIPVEDTVNIGVNRSFRCERIKLDYLFAHDVAPKAIREDITPFNEYTGNNCVKFYGISGGFNGDSFWSPSESDVIKANAFRYRTANLIDMRIERNDKFDLDILNSPLADFGSVVFAAFQFALWTNPKRIYLVGCDCSNEGYFYQNNGKNSLPTNKLMLGYTKLKQFAEIYYPDTEIISVNPVGLKGLFRDWYQSEEPCPPPRG